MSPRLLVQRDKSSLILDEATPDDVRAAVLPLIDYEAAAIAEYENRGYLAETWGDNDSWMPYMDVTREAAKRVVDAALGLKETLE